MKLLKLKEGVMIDIIHEDHLNQCREPHVVLSNLKQFKTTKEQYFETHEFFDNVRFSNIVLKRDTGFIGWPDIVPALFAHYDFFSEFCVIKNGKYYAMVHQRDLELLA